VLRGRCHHRTQAASARSSLPNKAPGLADRIRAGIDQGTGQQICSGGASILHLGEGVLAVALCGYEKRIMETSDVRAVLRGQIEAEAEFEQKERIEGPAYSWPC
jgi:hypothetical protein